MIYSKPCCEDLRVALSSGDKGLRPFARSLGGPLALSCYSHVGEIKHADGRTEPLVSSKLLIVYFCPFCGSELQTKEGVDDWNKKFPTGPNG